MTTTTGTASSRPVASAYTYDHAGRLTTVKHKLNSQAEVTLVSNTYDELGRLKSQAPHGSAANKLAYSYNIRGWLTGISGGKFTQSLYYNTGTGTPQYGGNVSSMTWKAGNESTTRGYKFAYDGLNRLTSATYGEGANISTNANRFTEKVTAYDAQGNILALQRYGQTGASSYGLLDNLTYTLDGNRVTRVDDASTATAYNNGFAFKDAVKQDDEYTYDKNGNLTQDLNKNILQIEYNALNLPCEVTFGNGNTISYLYSADGTKLRTVHTVDGVTATTDYVGNVIYENGSPQLLLTEAGYVSLSDGKYHYYLRDHQGNNRVVIASNGAVEEVNHYYPFGGVFAASGDVQPYKYNGKELDRKSGLDWYDYEARHYDAALGRFLTVDPLAQKYWQWSPYAYCLDNPVRYVDPDGRKVYFAEGVSDRFKQDFAKAVQHLNKHGAGGLLAKLHASENVYYIAEGEHSRFFSDTKTIMWNSRLGLMTNNLQELSPTTMLNHEIDHALQYDENPEQQAADKRMEIDDYGNMEEKRVITGSEQETARALGEIDTDEVTRTDHYGTPYVTTGPTSTEWEEPYGITRKKKE